MKHLIKIVIGVFIIALAAHNVYAQQEIEQQRLFKICCNILKYIDPCHHITRDWAPVIHNDREELKEQLQAYQQEHSNVYLHIEKEMAPDTSHDQRVDNAPTEFLIQELDRQQVSGHPKEIIWIDQSDHPQMHIAPAHDTPVWHAPPSTPGESRYNTPEAPSTKDQEKSSSRHSAHHTQKPDNEQHHISTPSVFGQSYTHDTYVPDSVRPGDYAVIGQSGAHAASKPVKLRDNQVEIWQEISFNDSIYSHKKHIYELSDDILLPLVERKKQEEFKKYKESLLKKKTQQLAKETKVETNRLLSTRDWKLAAQHADKTRADFYRLQQVGEHSQPSSEEEVDRGFEKIKLAITDANNHIQTRAFDRLKLARANLELRQREEKFATDFEESEDHARFVLELQASAEEARENNNHTWSEWYSKRAEALQKTLDNPHLFEGKIYRLFRITSNCLEELQLDPSNFLWFYGNSIQTHLHHEIVEIINGTAKLRQDYAKNEQIKNLTTVIFQCSDTTRQYNHLGKIRKACLLNDVAYSLWEYGKAIGQGLSNWGEGYIKPVLHPIDTVKETISSLEMAGTTIGRLILEQVELRYLKHIDGKGYKEKYDARTFRLDALTELIQASLDEFTKLSGPKKVEYATTFVADWFLSPKCSALLSKLCSLAKIEALSLKGTIFGSTAFGILSDEDKAKIITKGALVAVLGKGLDGTKEFAKEAFYVMQERAQDFKHWARKNGATIPVDSHISPERFEERIRRAALIRNHHGEQLKSLEELKDVTKFFKESNVTIPHLPGLTEKPLLLKFDPDHAYLPDLSFKIPSGKIARVAGLHADPNGTIELLGKIGEHCRLEVQKTGKSINGFEEVIYKLAGERSRTKSIFPKDLSWMQCSEKTVEAAKNLLKNTADIGKDGKLNVHGMTRNGEIIKFIIRPQNGVVDSFFPDIDEMIRKLNN